MNDLFSSNPWGNQGSDTPRASRAPTPAPSSPGGSIYTDGTNPNPPSLATNDSPTESLFPVTQPQSWTFNGIPYDSLDAAAAAAAEGEGIAAHVRDWVLQCFKLYAQRDNSQIYNLLGAKVTEHRVLARHEIQAVDTRIRDLDERLSHQELLAHKAHKRGCPNTSTAFSAYVMSANSSSIVVSGYLTPISQLEPGRHCWFAFCGS